MVATWFRGPYFGSWKLFFRGVSDSGFGIQSSGFGVRDVQNSDFWSGGLELGLSPGHSGGRGGALRAIRDSSFGYQVSDIRFRIGGFGYEVSGRRFRV